MALACGSRRRQPLSFLIAVVALIFASPQPQAHILAADHRLRRTAAGVCGRGLKPARALLGLAILVLASAVGELLIRHIDAANYATSLFTICAPRLQAARSVHDGQSIKRSSDDLPAGGRATTARGWR